MVGKWSVSIFLLGAICDDILKQEFSQVGFQIQFFWLQTIPDRRQGVDDRNGTNSAFKRRLK